MVRLLHGKTPIDRSIALPRAILQQSAGDRTMLLTASLRSASIALLLGGLAAAGPALGGEALTGRPHIVNGDTLRLRGAQVGLFGIAAPGLGQTCENAKGKSVQCGQVAARALAEHVGQASVSCEPRGHDRHKRMVAVCRLGSEDLSAWMVGRGLAVADRNASSDYVAQDTKAWATRRGLWAGVFEDPSHRKREDAPSSAAPAGAQFTALSR